MFRETCCWYHRRCDSSLSRLSSDAWLIGFVLCSPVAADRSVVLLALIATSNQESMYSPRTNSATITEIVGSENNVVKQCYGTCLKKQMQVLNRIITGGGGVRTTWISKFF